MNGSRNYATFAAGIARRGNVAFISQSGALCTAVLDWSLREEVGFSAFVSIGSMFDVGWGDLISYFGDDANTKSIVIYMESIVDARSFLSAAREVALSKPIITSNLAEPKALPKRRLTPARWTGRCSEAAFKRCGVLRVNHISICFTCRGHQATPPTRQTPDHHYNAGGPGVLATDAPPLPAARWPMFQTNYGRAE
jgi:acetyltransferase